METLTLGDAATYTAAPATAAPALSNINFSAVQTRGFVVIRNFLSQEELDILVQDHAQSRALNGNYPITYAGPGVFPLLRDKILQLSQAVGKVTSTHVDADQGGVYFSVKKGIKFAWHQDHESFYMNQNHIDYLNFYMVIVKEKAEEANLHVVPFDKFRAKSSPYYDRVVGQGAISYEVRDGETHIKSDEPGEKIGVLPYDIGQIAETPHLNAGDLLLLRGDSIHSTQASDTARVALSIRMVNSQSMISLKKMVHGNRFKMVMMMNQRSVFYKIFSAFERLKTNNASYGELIGLIAVDNSPTPSKLKFILKVVLLRLRLLFAKR